MKRLLGLLLVITLTATLSACNWFTKNTNSNFADNKVLVVGYDPFSGKFSPFFADTAYDQDVVSMVNVGLLTTDRDGGIVYQSIEGQDITRGTDSFNYKGISDITVTKGESTTEYDIKIRNDIKFSDGQPLTADDIIFTYYVLLDPYYVGSTTLNSVNIVGLKNYLKNSSLGDAAVAVQQQLLDEMADDDTDNDNATLVDYTKTQIRELLASEFTWVKDDVLTNAGYKSYWKCEDGTAWAEGKTASAQATFAGFYALEDDYSVVGKSEATVIDEVAAQYGVDFATLDANYGGDYVGPLVKNKAFDLALAIVQADEGTQGDPVANITGITKVNQYEVKVVTNGFDAAAIYQICGITVAPMHYYGDPTLYNYAENKFGFHNRTEDSMTMIQDKTDNPLGAGPYKFVKYENNVVYFEANPLYYKGAPKIKYINFQVVAEQNKISGITTGDIDVSNPSGSRTRFQEIQTINQGGEKIFVSSIDNLGYGYIGINARNVNIGGEIGSEHSKDLRKAFATVLASQRYTAVNSYYGQAASVINYPISNTSWAAPKAGENGYQVAYSEKPDGAAVYTNADPSKLSDSDRSIQAKAAAKAWLEAAGYTFETRAKAADEIAFGNDFYTATAPTGGKTTFEVIIPGGGTGDHPSFAVVTQFKNIMRNLGFTININDPADSNVLWDELDAGSQEIWCAAWGATIDPDMYQIYFSTNVLKALGGSASSSESNHYFIQDSTLDAKIMAARSTDVQADRKALYKQALDIIMDWGVEVPIYQRQNMITISSERVDVSTLTPTITTYWGWMAEIEKLQMK